jgi:hypothetical protein
MDITTSYVKKKEKKRKVREKKKEKKIGTNWLISQAALIFHTYTAKLCKDHKFAHLSSF